MSKTYNLAFDLGASSGRLVLSEYDEADGVIKLEEVHRFANESVYVGNTIYWDTLRLLFEMKEGLKKAAALNLPISGIATCTWGVDYGLIDKQGNLIGMPIGYRDARTNSVVDEVKKILPLDELYEKTGIEIMGINTIFQLCCDYQNRPEIINSADKLLMMPDLFNFFLCGVARAEHTIATTGQYIDAAKKTVLKDVLAKLGINTDLFAEGIAPGTILGNITAEVANETGLTEDVKVIAIGSHDTASAVCATPFAERCPKDAAYLSSGTWSLLGLEIDTPLINAETFKHNYTNEGGVEDTIRFLKNINGLWFIQELRRTWNTRTAKKISFADITAAAADVKDCGYSIDVSDPVFTAQGDMAEKIKKFCIGKGQGTPETLGELAMAVYNGLADEYRKTVNTLEKLTDYELRKIHMIGGGTQNELLCRLTAEATGKTVIAGPVEGSVLGNVIMQLKALGKIASVTEGRTIVARSFEVKEYCP